MHQRYQEGPMVTKVQQTLLWITSCSHSDPSSANATLNHKLLFSNLKHVLFLEKELVKSLPLKAWDLIKKSTTSSSSTLLNLHTFLILQWTPYLWRRHIMMITISVSPDGERVVTTVSKSLLIILPAYRITFVLHLS